MRVGCRLGLVAVFLVGTTFAQMTEEGPGQPLSGTLLDGFRMRGHWTLEETTRYSNGGPKGQSVAGIIAPFPSFLQALRTETIRNNYGNRIQRIDGQFESTEKRFSLENQWVHWFRLRFVPDPRGPEVTLTDPVYVKVKSEVTAQAQGCAQDGAEVHADCGIGGPAVPIKQAFAKIKAHSRAARVIRVQPRMQWENGREWRVTQPLIAWEATGTAKADQLGDAGESATPFVETKLDYDASITDRALTLQLDGPPTYYRRVLSDGSVIRQVNEPRNGHTWGDTVFQEPNWFGGMTGSSGAKVVREGAWPTRDEHVFHEWEVRDSERVSRHSDGLFADATQVGFHAKFPVGDSKALLNSPHNVRYVVRATDQISGRSEVASATMRVHLRAELVGELPGWEGGIDYEKMPAEFRQFAHLEPIPLESFSVGNLTAKFSNTRVSPRRPFCGPAWDRAERGRLSPDLLTRFYGEWREAPKPTWKAKFTITLNPYSRVIFESRYNQPIRKLLFSIWGPTGYERDAIAYVLDDTGSDVIYAKIVPAEN